MGALPRETISEPTLNPLAPTLGGIEGVELRDTLKLPAACCCTSLARPVQVSCAKKPLWICPPPPRPQHPVQPGIEQEHGEGHKGKEAQYE